MNHLKNTDISKNNMKKYIRYCPFCKTEHEVTYEGTCYFQYLDDSSLKVYRCHKFNKEFKIKEYEKIYAVKHEKEYGDS